MAEITHNERKFKVGRDGLIKDIERGLLDICKTGFRHDERLKFLNKPSQFEDANPDELEVKDLPSLFVWCNGFTPSTDTLGGMSGEPIDRKMLFYCNVQYIIPAIETKDASDRLRAVAWWLFQVVHRNLDLGGIVLGQPTLEEVDLFPKPRIVNGKLMSVSNVNIKIVYPYNDRSRVSSRK